MTTSPVRRLIVGRKYRDVRACLRSLNGPDRRSSDSSPIGQVPQEFGDILTPAKLPHDIDVVVALEVTP